MRKIRFVSLLALLMCQSSAYAIDQNIKDWASNANDGLAGNFKAADPADSVPNFTTDPTGNEGYAAKPNQMSTDAVTQSATDPGAQLINGIPQLPNPSEEDWFQGATNITKDPSKVVDDLSGEYTECKEVTQPGETYSETKVCTDSLLPTTAKCAEGLKLETQPHFYYECRKWVAKSVESCYAGVRIDMLKESYRYKCEKGRYLRIKNCTNKLNVTVERSNFKYRPQWWCDFYASNYNSYGLDRKYLVIARSTDFHFEGKDRGIFYERFLKPRNTCNVYRDQTYVGNYNGWTYLFSGLEYHGCRPGDNLWDDGMCHSNKPVEFQAAVPRCPNGTTSSYGGCLSQPAWISGYIASNNKYQGRRCFANSWKRNTDFCHWDLNNGTGAYYHWDGDKNNGTTVTASLRGSAPGYPSTATMQFGNQRGSWSGTYQYETKILLRSNDVAAPTIHCGSGYSRAWGSAMCHSNRGHLEHREIDKWVYSCN